MSERLFSISCSLLRSLVLLKTKSYRRLESFNKTVMRTYGLEYRLFFPTVSNRDTNSLLREKEGRGEDEDTVVILRNLLGVAVALHAEG